MAEMMGMMLINIGGTPLPGNKGDFENGNSLLHVNNTGRYQTHLSLVSAHLRNSCSILSTDRTHI